MRSLQQESRVAATLVFLPLLYATFTWLLLSPMGRADHVFKARFGELVLLTWGVSFAMILLAYLMHLCLVRRPSRPLRELARDAKTHILAPDQLLARLAPLVMLAILLNSFSAFKSAIPLIKPFAYDALFANMDRIIFGTDPWRITHEIFSSPSATQFLQHSYNLWFVAMWLSVIYASLQTNFRALRAQYLFAFCLCWTLLGSFAALSLSSAGPCFYGLVAEGPDPFAPLMENLRLINNLLRKQGSLGVTSLQVQDALWKGYENSATGTGSGISAMPSLHVATSVLMARAAFALNRRAGVLLSLFALVIWIGSVHLGWHYAVDGMVSLPLALAVWALSGWIVRLIRVVDFPSTERLEALINRQSQNGEAAPERIPAPSRA